MGLEFLRVTAEQSSELLDLIALLYAHERIGFDPVRARAAIDGLLATPDWGAIWFLRYDGETAGYVVVTVGYSLEFGGRFGLLDELYVDDIWRDQGFGRQAVTFAEEWCREQGLHALRLEVGHDNARALGLYRRTGFEVHDRHFLTKRL
jgi:ribosomal protein S18 acetylase RimI-like enzyme